MHVSRSVSVTDALQAPLVWLHSEDPYLPSDLGAHLVHTKPEVDFAAVPAAASPLTLDVFLSSLDDVSTLPAWLHGVAPDSNGKTDGAMSTVVIVNDHGSGNVDAFYMYFYAYAPMLFALASSTADDEQLQLGWRRSGSRGRSPRG